MAKKQVITSEKQGKEKLDLVEFGRRMTIVREKLLGKSQVQMCVILDTWQGLLSRLENGQGGNIHMVFDFVNYLNEQNLHGHMMFRKDFDLNLFSEELNESSNKKKIVDEIAEIEKAALINYERIVVIGKLIK